MTHYKWLACRTTLEIDAKHCGATGTCTYCHSEITIPICPAVAQPLTSQVLLALALCIAFALALLALLALRYTSSTDQPRKVHAARPTGDASRVPPSSGGAIAPEFTDVYSPPPQPLAFRFSPQHRRVVENSLLAAGFPKPESITFDNGLLITQLRIPREIITGYGVTAEDVARKALLAVRNNVYMLPDSDPDWGYLLILKGSSPGLDLESLWGMSLLHPKLPELLWGPGNTLQNTLQAYQE